MFIYLSMSPTFGSKDMVIRKSEFVAKTQFLYFHKEIISVISSSPLCNDDNNSNSKENTSLHKMYYDGEQT